MTRHHIGDMPFRPTPDAEHCELCWQSADELSRVVIEPPARGTVTINGEARTKYRAARVVYACNRHRGEDTVGVPIAPSNTTMAPGTSKRRPQALALFDDTSLKRGGRRW